MNRNRRRIVMSSTLMGLLALAPALLAQNTSGSAGGGAMDSHPSAPMDSPANGPSSKMAKPATPSTLSATDVKFIKSAAQGGMEEVELGRMAAQKGSNPDVKTFGQRMVDDHSKANDQLTQLAGQKGVTLSSTLSPAKKGDVNKLAKLSGAAFDRKYVSMMVEDHKKDVAEFEKAAKKGTDSDLKSWAATTLPTLQDHLKMIEGISATLNKSKTGK